MKNRCQISSQSESAVQRAWEISSKLVCPRLRFPASIFFSASNFKVICIQDPKTVTGRCEFLQFIEAIHTCL